MLVGLDNSMDGTVLAAPRSGVLQVSTIYCCSFVGFLEPQEEVRQW